MKVLILRGVQGSGKSHFVDVYFKNEDLWFTVVFTVVVSADHHFMKDGVYKFDISKLGEAHAACMRTFLEWMATKTVDILLVDNTNVTAWEIAPYVLVAQAFSCEVAVLTIHCDPKVAAARNLHGVPEEVVIRKHEQLQAEKLPPMWRHFYDEAAAIEWLRS